MTRSIHPELIGDLVELVCQKQTQPSTLVPRIVSNFFEFKTNKDNAVLHPITEDEYKFLLDLCTNDNRLTLTGWIYSMREVQRRFDIPSLSCETETQTVEYTQTIVENNPTPAAPESIPSPEVLATTVTVEEVETVIAPVVVDTVTTTISTTTTKDFDAVESTINNAPPQPEPIPEISHVKYVHHDDDLYFDKEKLALILDNLKGQQDKKPLSEKQKLKYRQIIEKYIDEDGGISFSTTFQLLIESVLDERVPMKERLVHFRQIISVLSAFLTTLRTCDLQQFSVAKKLPIWNSIYFARSLNKLEGQEGLDLDKPLIVDTHFTWNDIVCAVDEITNVALNELRNGGTMDLTFLESVIRMRLYVFDNPPRKDEYRLLMMHKPAADDKNCNWFDSEHSNIVLNVYNTSVIGNHIFPLTEETATLLNELKSNDRKLVFTREDRDESDSTPLTELEWEQAVIQDFHDNVVKEIVGHQIITPRLLRSLYLSDPDIVERLNSEPHFRLQTIKAMGHTLQEHISLWSPEEIPSKKREAEDNEDEPSPKRTAL